jgi:signal transduction histidine kinase
MFKNKKLYLYLFTFINIGIAIIIYFLEHNSLQNKYLNTVKRESDITYYVISNNIQNILDTAKSTISFINIQKELNLDILTTYLLSLSVDFVFFAMIADVSDVKRSEFETLTLNYTTEFNGTIRGVHNNYYPDFYNFPAFNSVLGIDVGAETNRLSVITDSKTLNQSVLSSAIKIKRSGGNGVYIVTPFLNNYNGFNTFLFVTLDLSKLFPLQNVYIDIYNNNNNLLYSNKNVSKTTGSSNTYNFTILENIWNIKLTSEESPDYTLAYVSSIVYILVYFIIMFVVVKSLDYYKAKNRLKIENEKSILQMIQYVNHEIRNPLSVIKGLLELSIDDIQELLPSSSLIENEIPPILSNLYTANSSCDLLKHIVNDILDISKLQENKLLIEKRNIIVKDLVLELTKILNSKVQEKPNISVQYSYQVESIYTDKFRLIQIMINIITNALKFTNTGHIKINISLLENSNFAYLLPEDKTSIIITVEDTGRGIRPEQYGNIFAPFEQTESADYIRYGGVGLGMYLCKLLIQKLGGSIGFISELSVGTTFYFILNDAHLLPLKFPQ